jgi:hypothetical protein
VSGLGRDDERRNGRHLEKPATVESRLLKPRANFLEGECVPILGVNQHINGKEQREHRSSSLRISEKVRNDDGGAGSKRSVGLTNQCLAFYHAKAV